MNNEQVRGSINGLLKSDHFGIEILSVESVYCRCSLLKSDHFGIEMKLTCL